uniref:Uncharacterized protein n=1 Tax=Rhizophora mucronata TaxID=61149 RepID=A0A2P2PFM7_RHIMU
MCVLFHMFFFFTIQFPPFSSIWGIWCFSSLFFKCS